MAVHELVRDGLPIRTHLQNRGERVIGRNQDKSNVVLFQNQTPRGFEIHNLRVGLEQWLAVKIAASIHKHFGAAAKTIDEVAAPTILGKNSSGQGGSARESLRREWERPVD